MEQKMSDATMDLMIKQYYIPTLSAGSFVAKILTIILLLYQKH
jgi:hypothetical protein